MRFLIFSNLAFNKAIERLIRKPVEKLYGFLLS